MSRVRAAAIATALAALPLGLSSAARAQDSLPPAADILARYHEAVGAPLFAAVQSLHSTGEISIPAAGITGRVEIWQGRPNRTLMHATVPGFGAVQTGFTGTSGWSIDPADGARVLTGPEAAQAEDDAHFESHLRTPELVSSMTTIERTTLGGHDCHKVRTLWKSGRETMDCYSTESGLLVGSLRTHQSSTGPADALIIYEDYRQFGGVRIPTRIITRVEDIEQIITLVDVTLNGVPDSAFDPPSPIRLLLGG
jgi:hypothetical protein